MEMPGVLDIPRLQNSSVSFMALVPVPHEPASRDLVGENDPWGAVQLESHEPTGHKKRGRPAGLFGRPQLRARLREERQRDRGQQQSPLEDTIVRSAQQAVEQQAQTRLPGILSQFVNVGSSLQEQVAMFVQEQAQQEVQADEGAKNPAVMHLFSGRRPITTLAAMHALHNAEAQGISAASARKMRVAATVVEGAGYLWGVLLDKVADLLQHGCQGLWFGVTRRYDETPYKIRIQEDAALVPKGHAKQTGLAAKILQSELSVHALLYRPACEQHLLLSGRLPTYLQCMDAVTGEVTRECQVELESLIPNLEEVASQFRMRSCFPCTDRAAANIACEQSLGRERESWCWVHTFCEVHKCSGCQKQTAQLAHGHISGLTACAVSMQQAGVTAALRRLLVKIIDARLEVRVGEPRGEQHRAAVYDLFLPETLCTQTHSIHKRRSPALQSRKRRLILSRFLNSDIQEPGASMCAAR